MTSEQIPAGRETAVGQYLPSLLRVFAGWTVITTLLFLGNNHFIFWLDWPGTINLLSHLEWFGLPPLNQPLEGTDVLRGWLQLCSYLAGLAIVLVYVWRTADQHMRVDAERLSRFAAFIIRAAFWSVLIVGLVDMVISFLRVEEFLSLLVGEELTKSLGRPQFRGTYVHYPLIAVSVVIAFFVRSLGFTWLALLVVLAEFQIVISRFVFSYEQSFMGDLVRFWYAALFLFASAYALIDEGHVRVDVLYAHFSKRGKAWANGAGSLLLGLPLCWVILTQGMWGRGSSLNSPLLSFEISQQGFGMYTKYMMAGFLVVFALSMIVQFSSYFLNSAADLLDEPESTAESEQETKQDPEPA